MQSIDRRKFIGQAALAGVGLAGAGALVAACKRNPDTDALGLPPILSGAPKGKKLRAGLIGVGARGTGAAINFISSGS
jgi:myo-inositol 2-dehydrogenase/D-chiro-inositol 1-dehydrogenase